MKKMMLLTITMFALCSTFASSSKTTYSENFKAEKIDFMYKSKFLLCFGPLGCFGWDIETLVVMPGYKSGGILSDDARTLTVTFDRAPEGGKIVVLSDATGWCQKEGTCKLSSITIKKGTYLAEKNTVKFSTEAK